MACVVWPCRPRSLSVPHAGGLDGSPGRVGPHRLTGNPPFHAPPPTPSRRGGGHDRMKVRDAPAEDFAGARGIAGTSLGSRGLSKMLDGLGAEIKMSAVKVFPPSPLSDG